MSGVTARIPPQTPPGHTTATPQQRWAARRDARRRRPMDTKARALIWFSLSLLCFAGAVIYLLLPTDRLPQFFPGYDPAVALHETQRAVVCSFFFVVTLMGGMVTLASGGVPARGPRVRTTPVLREPASADRRIRSVASGRRRR